MQLAAEAAAAAQVLSHEVEAARRETTAHQSRAAALQATLEKERQAREAQAAANHSKHADMDTAMSLARLEWAQKLRNAEIAMVSTSEAAQRDLDEAVAALEARDAEVAALQEAATAASAAHAHGMEATASAFEVENAAYVQSMQAEVEGWRMRATSLQRRLEVMEQDMVLERRAAATAIVEAQRQAGQHQAAAKIQAEEEAAESRTTSNTTTNTRNSNDTAATAAAAHRRSATAANHGLDLTMPLTSASSPPSSPPPPPLSRSKFEAHLIARVEEEARAVVEELEAQVTAANARQAELQDQNRDLRTANAAMRAELDSVSRSALAATEAAVVDAKRACLAERMASEQRQLQEFAARAHAQEQAVLDAKGEARRALSQVEDLQDDAKRAQERALRAEREASLEREARLQERAEWEERAARQLEKRRQRQEHEEKRGDKEREERRVLLRARDTAQTDAQQWQEKAKRAESENLELLARHAAASVQATAKVASEARALKEQLVAQEENMALLRRERGALQAQIERLEKHDTFSEEDKVFLEPERQQAQQRAQRAQRLEEDLVDMNATMDMEREARNQAEQRADKAEAALAELELELFDRAGGDGENGSHAVVLPALKVGGGEEISAMVSRDNAALRKVLAHSVSEMRSMQREAALSQQEIHAQLEDAGRMRAEVAALEDELLSVKRAHAALGFESQHMVEASVAAERLRCEEAHAVRLENMRRLHARKERALLDTGELATEALAKALSRAKALEEENAKAAKVMAEL